MMLQRALDKRKLVVWEKATVAEREMCMHLPQDELINAIEGGNGGVDQLLESVRISLMVEDAAVHRNADAAGRKHQRGKDAPKKQSWRKKDMQEGSEVQGIQQKEVAPEADDDGSCKGSRAKASNARTRTGEADAAAPTPSKATGQGSSAPKDKQEVREMVQMDGGAQQSAQMRTLAATEHTAAAKDPQGNAAGSEQTGLNEGSATGSVKMAKEVAKEVVPCGSGYCNAEAMANSGKGADAAGAVASTGQGANAAETAASSDEMRAWRRPAAPVAAAQSPRPTWAPQKTAAIVQAV